MNLLLDTRKLLWWLSDDSRLPTVAREEISSPENEILVSAATAWEMPSRRQPAD